jgi:hypothetical protein
MSDVSVEGRASQLRMCEKTVMVGFVGGRTLVYRSVFFVYMLFAFMISSLASGSIMNVGSRKC